MNITSLVYEIVHAAYGLARFSHRDFDKAKDAAQELQTAIQVLRGVEGFDTDVIENIRSKRLEINTAAQKIVETHEASPYVDHDAPEIVELRRLTNEFADYVVENISQDI